MRAVFVSTWVFGAVLWAQSGAGTISGVVLDSDGKPLAMTPVEAANTGTKAKFQAMSSAKGEYSITKLPAGTYDVSVATSILVFDPFTRKGIAVRDGQNVKIDIRVKDGVTLNTLGEDREAIALMFTGAKPPEGPLPRLLNGKPDLSGMWTPGAFPDAPPGDAAAGPEKAAALPWAEKIAQERIANHMRDLPSSRCLPNGITAGLGPVQFLHTASRLGMLFEGQHPRMVFLDGRSHPKDLNPTWLGHSVGRWDGDTLVIDTVGFNDKTWLDLDAHPHTDKMQVVERFRRKDLGHMESEMTVEDPGALTKPWKQKMAWVLDPKNDVTEALCTENERDAPHLRAK